jgi:hypothetical protein
MILPSLVIPELCNQYFTESGLDSYKNSFNKEYFKTYPYTVEYKYNERGYRDKPWPNNLQDCIWCIGDSFTVGIGSPYEHTWAQILERRTGIRVVNVSMDGASNQWISRIAKEISKTIQPKNIICMWSFAHRRERPAADNGTDLERRTHYTKDSTKQEDLMTFSACVTSLIRTSDKVNYIHSTIPNATDSEITSQVFENISNFIGEVKIIDYARDSFHFDIKTSTSIVDKIMPLL